MEILINIEGLDSIDDEIRRIDSCFQSCLDEAVAKTKKEMPTRLQKHIQEDVYDAYEPHFYVRRVENPSFGTPIISGKNMHIKDLPFRRDKGRGFVFSYEPNGYYNATYADYGIDAETLKRWHMRQDGTTKIVPHPVHGDELITRIETGNDNWRASSRLGDDGESKIEGRPPRPFFTPFAKEMIDRRFGAIVKSSLAKFEKEFDARIEGRIKAEREGGSNGLDFI